MSNRFIERLILVALATLALALVSFAGLALIAWMMFGGRGRMTSATSPDGRYCITLDERACGIDRNFNLYLWDRDSDREHRLEYDGYDQSPVIKREHFVWSSDSKRVALVGDDYFAIPEAKLPSGDWLYVVYDTEADKLYCNVAYERELETPYPADLAVETFGEAILERAPMIE